MIARQQSHYLQQRAPVMLPIYTTTLSVFIIHISCGAGMKEELFPSPWRAGYDWLSGRKAPNKMERGFWVGVGGVIWEGGFFTGFKASKQAAQTEKKYFP